MKINTIIFGFLFFGLLMQAKAQDALFNVLASKGSVKYIAAGTTEEKNIIIGKKLFPKDKIVVGDNSYLGLAHKGGKTIEIKRSGAYEVSSLSAEIANQNASVSKKYVDFLAGEINSNGQDMSKNKYKYMAVTGSVERGNNPNIIIYNTPNKPALVLNEPVTIYWEKKPGTTTYKVNLTNLFDEVVLSTETTDNKITLDLPKYKMAELKNLFLTVSSKEEAGVESEKINLKALTPKEEADITKQVQEMKAELKEETALNKYVLANFFAEKGLVVNAVEEFESAIAQEPDVEDFKASYGEYLVATQIKSIDKE